MSWQVKGGEQAPTIHATTDEAVDALMVRVRSALDAMDEQTLRRIVTDQDLWRADTTTDLLKRYLSSPEGSAGDADFSPKNLRVVLGEGDVSIEQAFTLSEVMAEFAPEGVL